MKTWDRKILWYLWKKFSKTLLFLARIHGRYLKLKIHCRLNNEEKCRTSGWKIPLPPLLIPIRNALKLLAGQAKGAREAEASRKNGWPSCSGASRTSEHCFFTIMHEPSLSRGGLRGVLERIFYTRLERKARASPGTVATTKRISGLVMHLSKRSLYCALPPSFCARSTPPRNTFTPYVFIGPVMAIKEQSPREYVLS